MNDLNDAVIGPHLQAALDELHPEDWRELSDLKQSRVQYRACVCVTAAADRDGLDLWDVTLGAMNDAIRAWIAAMGVTA